MYYLMLADGFEETEMIAPLDILRRAGIPVQTVGMTGRLVTGAHDLTVTADLLPEDVVPTDMDGIILPGGMPGTTNLKESETLRQWILSCAEEGKLLAAICAAPSILGELGLLKGRRAVCFPGFEDALHGAEIADGHVACDSNMITAKGAGAAPAFGAAIADYIKGTGAGAAILAQMQTPGVLCNGR